MKRKDIFFLHSNPIEYATIDGEIIAGDFSKILRNYAGELLLPVVRLTPEQRRSIFRDVPIDYKPIQIPRREQDAGAKWYLDRCRRKY